MGYEEPATMPKEYSKEKLLTVLPAYINDKNKKSLQNFLSDNLSKFDSKHQFTIKQYIGLIGVIMGITNLSDEQRNVLQYFFNNEDARAEISSLLEKLNEQWNMRGTLVFERLVSILQKDYLFTYGYVDKDRRYPVLYKNIDDNFSLYFNDQSPNIQVGFHSKRGILKFPYLPNKAILDELSSLELAQKHELEARMNNGRPIFWHYVDLPIDDFNSVEEAVDAFVNIAKDLLKVNMTKLTHHMKFKDEFMN